MSKKYTKKTSRSRRKLQPLKGNGVKVELGQGRATIQMVLPMEELMGEVAMAVENMASQVGLLLMKGLIDEEVEQLAGKRYAHNPQRQANRCGKEDGHVVYRCVYRSVQLTDVRQPKFFITNDLGSCQVLF